MAAGGDLIWSASPRTRGRSVGVGLRGGVGPQVRPHVGGPPRVSFRPLAMRAVVVVSVTSSAGLRAPPVVTALATAAGLAASVRPDAAAVLPAVDRTPLSAVGSAAAAALGAVVAVVVAAVATLTSKPFLVDELLDG